MKDIRNNNLVLNIKNIYNILLFIFLKIYVFFNFFKGLLIIWSKIIRGYSIYKSKIYNIKSKRMGDL